MINSISTTSTVNWPLLFFFWSSGHLWVSQRKPKSLTLHSSWVIQANPEKFFSTQAQAMFTCAAFLSFKSFWWEIPICFQHRRKIKQSRDAVRIHASSTWSESSILTGVGLSNFPEIKKETNVVNKCHCRSTSSEHFSCAHHLAALYRFDFRPLATVFYFHLFIYFQNVPACNKICLQMLHLIRIVWQTC